MRRKIFRQKKYLLIPAAAILIFVIVLIATNGFQGGLTGSGIKLEDSCWQENEAGFKYYDKEGYENTFGIDISEWVGDVDFTALKDSGVEFVILRVGYRGYETGKFVLDNNLSTYLRNAKKAGVKTGVYFVSQAVSEEEAVEEAQYVMDHIKGYDMQMPLYLDLEDVLDPARTDSLTKAERTKIALAFCEAVEENGYQAGIYANEHWFLDKLIFRKISDYDIWLAKYTDTPSTEIPIHMWQFTGEGLVSGSELNVDLNVRVSRIPSEEETGR